jgi:hypothetical protein
LFYGFYFSAFRSSCHPDSCIIQSLPSLPPSTISAPKITSHPHILSHHGNHHVQTHHHNLEILTHSTTAQNSSRRPKPPSKFSQEHSHPSLHRLSNRNHEPLSPPPRLPLLPRFSTLKPHPWLSKDMALSTLANPSSIHYFRRAATSWETYSLVNEEYEIL